MFNTVHNVQAGVPVANLLALFEAVNEFADTSGDWVAVANGKRDKREGGEP